MKNELTMSAMTALSANELCSVYGGFEVIQTLISEVTLILKF